MFALGPPPMPSLGGGQEVKDWGGQGVEVRRGGKESEHGREDVERHGATGIGVLGT